MHVCYLINIKLTRASIAKMKKKLSKLSDQERQKRIEKL